MYICSNCGSEGVRVKVWINANYPDQDVSLSEETELIISTINTDCQYCPDCEEPFHIKRANDEYVRFREAI